MPTRRTIALTVVVSSVLAWSLLGNATGTEQEPSKIEAAAKSLDKVVGSGQKVCSIFHPNNWRDSLNVPSAFTSSACDDYRAKVGGTHLQLACLYSNGMAWGAAVPGGTAPPAPTQNCGW